MAYWLKLGYHTGARETASYWLDLPWVSDSPGRQSRRWRKRRRPRRGDVYPPFGPRYAVGDRLVMYLTGPKKCPAILEVIREPYWDPTRVDRESTGPAEGDRWGVVTEVKAVAALPLDQAPAVELLSIAPSSLGQKGHLALEDRQYAEAEHLITRSRRRRTRRRRRAGTRIPIEQGNVEGYDVTTGREVRRAERRESRLVRDYAAALEAQGDSMSRNRLPTPDGSATLLSDAFNESRKQLIEAKAGLSRGDVRMAIGQLADYSRLLDPPPERAVLLEAKPEPDLLELLSSQGIKAIWREGDGFADDAGGRSRSYLRPASMLSRSGSAGQGTRVD